MYTRNIQKGKHIRMFFQLDICSIGFIHFSGGKWWILLFYATSSVHEIKERTKEDILKNNLCEIK